VAEMPSIVNFGSYVDSHLWSYYLFTFATSYIGGYIYTCACCKKRFLNKKDNFIVIGMTILPLVLFGLFPTAYTPMLYICFIAMPTFVNAINKRKDLSFNTIICYSLDQLFSALTLEIRDISILVSYPNSATFTILLIDGFIWRGILYLCCNYEKGGKNNG
jgi:hypothetical protein